MCTVAITISSGPTTDTHIYFYYQNRMFPMANNQLHFVHVNGEENKNNSINKVNLFSLVIHFVSTSTTRVK